VKAGLVRVIGLVPILQNQSFEILTCRSGYYLSYGGSFDMMMVLEAANMPPTPWRSRYSGAPGIYAGAVLTH
jgi:hypothetical protein